MKKFYAFLFVALIGLSACSNAPQMPLETAPSVDLNRYLGDWYEVAMVPNKFQKNCVADTLANYALETTWTGDVVRVTNRCRKADGSVQTAQGVAKIVEGSQSTKLRVSFFRPFYGNYWILALGDNYDWVLVGEPGREFGWVLSRSPTLNSASLNAALDTAVQQGYARSQFVSSLQTRPLN